MITNILGTFLVATTMVFSKPNKVLPIQIDENAETLTLTADELNNNTYEYLATQLNQFIQEDEQQNPTSITNTTITYNNETYNIDEIIVDEYIQYINQNNDLIDFVLLEGTTYGKWQHSSGQFTGSLTINNASVFIENIAEPTQETIGGSIIGSITSGLGLISALTSEFLLGFNTMIWQNGALTNVGLFAFVMLGISVSFAIVKLILHLLRRNTGA